ncbi:hypothetical protein OOP60_002608 [Salmonella enterica]|nr:hypothetical protein [Salmonella enterica subsp. enterica serovar Newport]EJG5925296.1 hypothetical protein [Salmonella enterica]EKB5402257.1 hypothetical protein [Salmonella enterica]EKB5474391.1 hypothetical protein [Salmonella enterica]EKC2614338.1 hypothetical protein [Salmonella enterica]
MKLCLNLEADRINVLALNMGRIAVEVDGIDLAELIDVVCDNGYSLRVVEESDKQAAESTLPPFTSLSGMCCSTAHITGEDNAILDQASLQQHDGGDSDWILYTGYGFLLRLNARRYPVLALKRMGMSKACRRLVVTLIRRYAIGIIHLDAFGELLPGFEIFDW